MLAISNPADDELPPEVEQLTRIKQQIRAGLNDFEDPFVDAFALRFGVFFPKNFPSPFISPFELQEFSAIHTSKSLESELRSMSGHGMRITARRT
jgi:hypothetical protein